MVKTIEDILELRPTFKFGGTIMVEWFNISRGKGYCCITSGLKHTDGETKSPYHYSKCIGGDNALEKSVEGFNEWWNSLTNKII